MRAWRAPAVPQLPGAGTPPRLHDRALGHAAPIDADQPTQLYVCGITPYDATHMGHAATYLAFDTLNRAVRDAGLDINYVQNVTDVDDPLLERATATGVDWRELAASQIELYHNDMELLRVIPPERYIGVVESVDDIATACATLLNAGLAYWVDSENAQPDLYFDVAAAEATTPWTMGQESGLDRTTMLALSAQRGGDPDRPGKRDALDPLLWRAERVGEPAWDGPIGRGRPGWHIECSAIGLRHLRAPVTLNGGGSDLIFPHHEMSAAHSAALSGVTWSKRYAHAGMVAYQGEKMSKSLGNLVLVSTLVAAGVDPQAIRLALLGEHYRSNWEWTDAKLDTATARLQAWRTWATEPAGSDTGLLQRMRERLADDLDTRGALELIDEQVARATPPSDTTLAAIDALLGIELR